MYLHLYCAIAQKEEQSAGKVGEKEKEEEKKKNRKIERENVSGSFPIEDITNRRTLAIGRKFKALFSILKIITRFLMYCTPTNQIIHFQLQVLFPK